MSTAGDRGCRVVPERRSRLGLSPASESSGYRRSKANAFNPNDLNAQLDTLFRYTVGVTGDPHLAADMVQDTVVRALERRDQYRADAPLGHWLIRIAHNLIVDKARKTSHELLVDEVEERWREDNYTVDTEVVVQQAATRAELRDALIRLPFIYRSAVVLHDVEGLRVVDIAAIHNISLPAAKQRLRRGRMAMVTALADGAQRQETTKGVPMRCWEARRQISDYLDGELDGATAATVKHHLSQCPTCPPLYAALVGVCGELSHRRDPDSVVEPQLVQRIQAIIDSA